MVTLMTMSTYSSSSLCGYTHDNVYTTAVAVCVVTLMTMSTYSSSSLCGYTHDNVYVQQ